ncbi:MAG: ABC transporter permease [Steroidobacteraceae bacterium]
MGGLILRRLMLSVPLLFVVTAVTFVLESLVPGNTARAIIGATGSEAAYERLRSELGLNHPIWYQYAHYINGVLHGSLGVSAITGAPVSTMLAQRVPVTLSLVGLTTLFCGVVGIALGVVSAVRGGWLGKLLDFLSYAGLALPSFWLGLVLVLIFSVTVHLFPSIGYVGPSTSLSGWFRSLCLPALALGLAGIAGVAKQSRDSMMDVLQSQYIRTLRASGLSRWRIVWKHALRNAAIPAITVIGLVFVSSLSTSVFIEQVFVLPGLGSLAVTATGQHDITVIEGIALYFTLFVVAANLLLDVVYAALNPKIRRR